mgnify:CR=1 FL=1
MRKAYIVAAKRSAIGTFLGSLTDVDLATANEIKTAYVNSMKKWNY